MQRLHALLFDVWREACQHIEIATSVSRIARLLEERVQIRGVLVRRIDHERRTLETVASSPPSSVEGAEEARLELTAAAFEDLLDWCGHRALFRSSSGQEAPNGVLPPGIDDEVLAGPLTVEGRAAGVLVLIADRGRHFDREDESVILALLDPFSTALENDRRLREMATLRQAAEADKLSALTRLGRTSLTADIVGAELGLRPVLQRVDLVARSDVPVLLLGETGSGKEVVARAVHDRSARASGPFLRVNCGAITPELVDSELFGHERGSFTGAVATRKGWFERADGGTLFLDEIGELTLAAQVRLLRILQDGTFERVGGERQLHVDVRVVAATHRDLQSMVGGGRFREDLWYRISVFPIRLPPLRERVEDIPALAVHFAVRASRRFGTRPLAPTPDDLKLLASYPWPGNVRELAAVIDRAAILGDGKRLDVATALGAAPAPGPPSNLAATPLPGTPRFETLDGAMRRHIESVLEATRGQVEGPDGAARMLAINPHTLRARMRKLGVDWARFRGA